VKREKNQLISSLESEGLRFKSFTRTHEGRYSPEDADWNYKDVPHLHHVHEMVEAIISSVDDDSIATINLQNVFSFQCPMAVFNYQTKPGSQIYYTTFFFFILIVETVYEELAPLRTRVVTTYSVGSSRWLTWCFPFIRWCIKRNYKVLMAADLPMRFRRGQLREWGYTFNADGPTYSFQKTMDITTPNVVVPRETQPFDPVAFSVNEEIPDGDERFLGRDDHLGLRLVRRGSEILVFPRLCPHEGASLDSSGCRDSRVFCLWHGRGFQPLAKFSLDSRGPHEIVTPYHHLVFSEGRLSIREKQPSSLSSK
jgi:hypothetical protein